MSSTAKKFATALLSGALMVSGAWAGASFVPVDDTKDPGSDRAAAGPAVRQAQASPAPAPPTEARQAGTGHPPPPRDPSSLPDGQVLAGAARMSILPRPKDFDGTWEQSQEKCATLSENALADPGETGDHLAAAGSPWPENPNCIYMGGFGIGPMNPVTSWDEEYGLWVRAVALRDREGDDLVLVVLDGEGYFWDYGSKCDDCGIKQLTARFENDASLGVKAENFIIAATHAHSAPDFIGGWGFVPDWYMKQVSGSIKWVVRKALAKMRPAVLEYGEREARAFNRERRDTYRSAEEQQLAWLRAYRPRTSKTVATIGSYAAHPTTFGTNDGKAHPDWPGLFEASLEKRFGGLGMHFMTGLGNVSAAGLEHVDDPKKTTGADDLAALVARVGRGNRIEAPDIKTARTTWEHPVTNAPLTALGAPGFFDREFVERPSTVRTGEDPDKFQCVSSAPVSAEVAVSAARIGDEFALTGAPGEIFSNGSNTLKENSGAAVTMPLGQANDALGYMPQSFEMNQVAQQGPGFAGELQGYVFVNYEDSYAIDKCFGDMAVETSIGLLKELK
jgi:hypothetical protein